jgi:carboxymethylenebutenolidase
MSTSNSLSATQSMLNRLWEAHTTSEFAHKSPEEAIATMTDNPQVIHVPTLIGGRGREELHTFYAKHFLNQLPPDLEIVPLSRTLGDNRIVDELVARFTHSITVDWALPGIPPTHKRVEFALVVIVEFEHDKISSERIYYDQATVLRQIGLLPDPKLPVLGAESARGLLEPTPLNQLLHRTAR